LYSSVGDAAEAMRSTYGALSGLHSPHVLQIKTPSADVMTAPQGQGKESRATENIG